MNKNVFIKQNGTIPGHRIIEELERRGGENLKGYSGDSILFPIHYITDSDVIEIGICTTSDYTELLYDKETDTFYERDTIINIKDIKVGSIITYIGKYKDIERVGIMIVSSMSEGYPRCIWGKTHIDGSYYGDWNPGGYKYYTANEEQIAEILNSVPDYMVKDVNSIIKGKVKEEYIIKYLVNKEPFCKIECSDCINDKGCINCQDGNMKEVIAQSHENTDFCKAYTPMEESGTDNNMCLVSEGEYIIPEGYEAKIEDGKVIISKKKWQVGDTVYYPQIHGTNISIPHFWVRKSVFNNECTVVQELLFPTSEECQTFCDKLNAALKPILEERRKEVE